MFLADIEIKTLKATVEWIVHMLQVNLGIRHVNVKFLLWSEFSVVLKTSVKGLAPLLACDYLANAATEFAFI